MQIKTLADILAESDADSASTPTPKAKPAPKHNIHKGGGAAHTRAKKSQKPRFPSPTIAFDDADDTQDAQQATTPSHDPKKRSKRKKRFHPAATFVAEPSDTSNYKPPEPQSIKAILAEVKNDSPVDAKDTDDTDNLPSALKAYLRSPEQKQNEIDAIKAESRLRWLAFYYLSRREYGRAELKQKLLDKEQDPEQIEALLDEFRDKGYQSDYRTTLMLIRENIRKGRGRERIKQAFYQKKMPMPSNVDELIDMAQAESEAFSEFVDDDEDSLVEGVDWLKLAVTARTKKYGDALPTDQKEKARQLRFLQYRGFKSEVCFAALNHTLATLAERF